MNLEKHHRRSIRLKDYDYAQAGAYFVTIVAHERACLFGSVEEGEMRLNDAGEMICKWWKALPSKFFNAHIDEFILMPNHLHGIIVIHPIVVHPIVGANQCVRPSLQRMIQ